jgi:hypothetical protein
MNPEIVLILDRAFQYSLWLFLFTFVLLLVYAGIRLRRHTRRIGDLFEGSFSEGEEGKKQRRFEQRPTNEWRLAFRALSLSLACSIAFFFIFVFTPFPLFENFASGDSWKISPLRITALTYDRFYNGFSLEGEVWNQTKKPVFGLQAVVKIWATDDALLDEVRAPVEPDPLAAGTAGRFSLNQVQNTPFLKGYQVSFVDRSGGAVPHVTGFDVQ